MKARRSSQSGYSRETVDMARLREILMTRLGEQAAIRARDLVVLLGLGRRDSCPERSVREAIGVLIRAAVPVGSTVTEPYAGTMMRQYVPRGADIAANSLRSPW